MSTNVDLDRELLDRARKALNGANIKDTVEEGLRRIVAEKAMVELSALMNEMHADPEQHELLMNLRDRAW